MARFRQKYPGDDERRLHHSDAYQLAESTNEETLFDLLDTIECTPIYDGNI